MRADLINAKEYKVGIKHIGENYHIFETYKTLEEATKAFEDYKTRGFNVIIKAVK